MDGLLLNTEDLYTEAYVTCLKRVDREYTFETKAKLMGRKPLESAAILLKELDLEDQFTPESWIANVSEEYPKVFPKCVLLPGVQRLIDHLVANNVPIAISTGSSNEAFDLKATNHTKFFTNFLHIVKCGSDPDVKNGKPAPDAFEVCRQRFSPVPEAKNCLAFEDAPNGVKSAIAAGMQVVMVPDR
ncbi:unnamed protein product [Oikopleura dioica]|uniref:Pseudouridine 5'-phosphatase n=1 Tax=Oikopleura dioica TaxID=34765 RepID=E4YLV2_OIKDI|nr:unnamed protein product [Oikopleura dioica]